LRRPEETLCQQSISSITRRPLASRTARAAFQIALVAIAYYVSARLGYLLALPGGLVTLWPPSGLMLGFLLLSPRRDWPTIVAGGLIGSFCSDLHSGFTFSFAVAAAAANGLETLVAASVVRWRLGRRLTLSSLRDVGELTIGAAILSNAVTAVLGAATLHRGVDLRLVRGWFIWWVGDGLGMLIVAPLVIGGVRAVQQREWTWRMAVEAVLLLIALAGLAEYALGPMYTSGARPGPYVIFPLLLWAGLRFGPAGAAAATLTVAAIGTWNAALGLGPFISIGASDVHTATETYAFLAVASLCGLIPAAMLEERTLALRRQRDSESGYRSVVEAATDAIITIDETSRIQFANSAVEHIFGYTPAELTGRALTILMSASDGARHDAGMARYLATGKRSIGWRAVGLTGIHKDGSEVPLEASFGDRMENGTRVFTGILRDITEKRVAERALDEAEDRMRFAQEASRLGNWDVEFATGVARWSPTLEALHGMPPNTFGGTFAAFIEQVHPDDRQQIQEEIERATRQHTDANILYRSIWPDGTTHWLSGVGRTFYDDAGDPVRAVGIGLDVTERRALEDQYRQSQKMEAVGQLAAGVAHDFNNLLTVIQGYTTMVSTALPNGIEKDDLGAVLQAADRAASLTQQLLAFSRQQVLAPRPLELSDTLRALEPMLRRLIGEHIELVIRAGSDVGQIVADPGQMEQVILNLALNARDAIAESGQLLLETTNVEVETQDERTIGCPPQGRYVLLAVTDTGVGMDAATVARVFEPFFTTKPVGQGTGLGLSTVYGIVKQSGGTIAVSSEPGRGTVFQVYLPRVDAPINAPSAASAVDEHRGMETILVVEDDPALLKMATRVLAQSGYRVLSAATPQQAIDLASVHADAIDLLVTDVVLPEMSGRAMAEQLTKEYGGLRVLYMSGYTNDAVVLRGVLEHETQFLQKPFGNRDLMRKVRETLDLPMTPDHAGAGHP
jgi:two-component system cell cycle sensor histidine kinase/response regulator CckA